MPFIGNQPAESYSAFQKQDFTTSATTSYTLDHSVANQNELALFINFVRQEPTAAYTASGTSLTLTSATSVGDDMYCVYLGKAVQTVVPPSNSVGSSQLASDAVTSSKLNDDIISGQTALASEPADTDEFLISDAGTLKRIDYSLIKGGSSNAFHAYDMSGGNASGTLVLTSELLDDGSNYNTSNGRYTAPSAGKYHFYCSAVSSTGSDSYINFHLNGSVINGGIDQGGNTPNSNTQGIMIATIDLSANDYITMVSQNSVYNNYIFFGGYKLY